MNALFMFMVMFNVSDSLTPENVYDYCVKQDIKHPEIVTAQAIWETGWFKCKDCSLDNNNLFGFTTGGPYLEFKSWKDCIEYYKRWQDKFYDETRNYYDFLKCIYKTKNGNCIKYCEDPVTYNECLKKTISLHHDTWKN